MKNIILHKNGTFSYKVPLSGRWVRRVDMIPAIELVRLTPAEQCRIMDHLLAWAFHYAVHGQHWQGRIHELYELEAALVRQREHNGE